MSTAPTPAAANPGRRIALIVVVLVPLTIGVVLLVISQLMGQPFDSVDQLDPADVKSLRVFLLNRKELDRGEDVGPYLADPADFAALLAPLRGVPEVEDQFPDARGPWLGEFRVQTKTGRKGTIRLYWVRTPKDPPDAPPRLRFQIGRHKYEGGSAAEVIKAAEAAAARGKAVR